MMSMTWVRLLHIIEFYRRYMEDICQSVCWYMGIDILLSITKQVSRDICEISFSDQNYIR